VIGDFPEPVFAPPEGEMVSVGVAKHEVSHPVPPGGDRVDNVRAGGIVEDMPVPPVVVADTRHPHDTAEMLEDYDI
jgi:hypothetical protein